MGSFSRPSMTSLLEGQRALLDNAFGVGAYQVESSDPEQAIVRSTLLDASFGCERDGQIGALIILRDPPADTCGDAETWLWAKFLGVETPLASRDKFGRVRAAPEEQLRTEIEMIGRLMKEIFSDPRRLRDAAFYVHGYTRAYNDRASGNR
ncbi:MAG TPA: hypothetical protein VMN38_03395 [Sphingomicrobium sp.]|nr:hypothetical protein [Sphingomicrobium sp.]